MRHFLVFLLSFAIASAGLAPLLHTDSLTVVPDNYIVVLKTEASASQVEAHRGAVQKIAGVQNIQNFDIGTFRGYSAKLSSKALNEIRTLTEVAYVEADQVASVSSNECNIQSNAVWGLDRISEVKPNLNGRYIYPTTTGSVDAYVIDTGIETEHINFAGHAIWGANFVAKEGEYDCNGHGTHVAGTIGSQTYGVSKSVTLIAVKVLGCSGSGTNSGVIQGVNYAASSYQSRKRPAVANMSLGGGKSTALGTAVKNAISLGLQFAIAGGNEDSNACEGTPSDVDEAVVVGATTLNQVGSTQSDTRAYFSNYGTCLDVFAPGQLIESTWIGPYLNETKTISGTSMASPHVCGTMALYLSENPTASASDLQSWITKQADYGLIDLACEITEVECKKSPNLMLYSPCAQ